MGAYAAWFDDRLAQGLVTSPSKPFWVHCGEGLLRSWHSLVKRFVSSKRVMLVADFEASEQQMTFRFGGPVRLHTLPCQPRHQITETAYVSIDPGCNPMRFGDALQQARRLHLDTVAFWLPWDLIRGQSLLLLYRNGFRWCWLAFGSNTLFLPLWILLAFRFLLLLCARYWPKESLKEQSLQQAQAIIDAQPQTPRLQHIPGKPWNIAYFMNFAWEFGGIQRQIAIVSQKQIEAGHHVEILWQTLYQVKELKGKTWIPQSIGAETVAKYFDPRFPAAWFARGLNEAALAELPKDYRDTVIDLAGELMLRNVDVLHCWSDDANLVGMLAARLAGIPVVVMTIASVAPARQPHRLRSWTKSWYRVALHQKGVQVVNLSQIGVEEYAEWLEEPMDRFRVIRLAFSTPALPENDQLQSFRQHHKLNDQIPVIGAVFRLEPDKRPLTFLDVIHRVKLTLPNLRVLWAGGGSMQALVDAKIVQLGLHDTIIRLGQPADILTPLAVADVFLMVSEVEGTPNVALEAQYAGAVPILTDVGGCRETMVPGQTGLVIAKDDVDGIASAVVALLQDHARRQQMAERARKWVIDQFSVDKIYGEVNDLYHSLFLQNVPPLRQSA